MKPQERSGLFSMTHFKLEKQFVLTLKLLAEERFHAWSKSRKGKHAPLPLLFKECLPLMPKLNERNENKQESEARLGTLCWLLRDLFHAPIQMLKCFYEFMELIVRPRA
mmetsp:Transcript_10748/g.28186  ORF Transcript_10748/g.28186 Transcript_10748/m.28186 type:complete len:109 (-) Transcript_10748:1703-2029(-)